MAVMLGSGGGSAGWAREGKGREEKGREEGSTLLFQPVSLKLMFLYDWE